MLKILITFVLLSGATAFAQTKTDGKDSKTETTRESDKLDIKKLEQKYWSAKDDDFNVVQNRRYTKAKRFFLSGNLGIPFNDPFATGTLASLQLGYFFNERWGLDFNYTRASFHDNDAVSQFISRYGIYPDRNSFDAGKMLSVTYVPLYAKMSFLDTSIIYFDMGVSVGLGQTDYSIKKEEGDDHRTAMAYQWTINQQIFFSEHLAFRVDLINRYTNEQRFKYRSNSTDRDQGMKTYNDSSLMIGLTYWH